MLVEHKDVAEAAVVPVPHPVKGEALYCFVTMNDGTTFSASTQTELIAMIRAKIAPFAMPDYIQVGHFCSLALHNPVTRVSDGMGGRLNLIL